MLAVRCGYCDQAHGDRMAGVLDPFGYKWWIAHALAIEAVQ